MKWKLGLALIALVGCQIPSRVALDGAGGRTAYNMAIQMTNSQQMLLNLVRLRYADSPLFLDVSSITTQSTFRTDLSPLASIPGFTSDNPFRLGADFLWEDHPTITYTPLEGPSFATRMLRPIDLRTIQLLCYSGWDIDRIFRMVIRNFADLSNDPSGPTFEDSSRSQNFFELSSLLRYFQKRGELQMGVKVKEAKDNDSDEVSLQISFPRDGKEGEQLAKLIHCDQSMNGNFVKEIQLGFTTDGHTGIMPRSILSCMYHLSHGVEVPSEHLENGMAREPIASGEKELDWQALFGELISVCWSHTMPKESFVAVKYRDYWFYIDECDLSSKRTFALLLQLYNLNAIVPKNRGPILTLPLGLSP